jgi:hypothetical protein
VVGNKLAALSPWLILATAVGAGCSKGAEVAQDQATASGVDQQAPMLSPDVATAQGVRADEARPGPAFASPTPATKGRPPHPMIPAPLEEPEPSQDMRASTSFRWLRGHWIWTGNQYVWQPGVWIYDVPGHTIVPPRWGWDGEYWGFQDTGWAAAGSTRISVRPTAVPNGNAGAAPEPDLQAPDVDVYVAPSSYAVYVWTGTWVAPPIVYPEEGALGDAGRYAPRTKSATRDVDSSPGPTERAADRIMIVGSEPSTAEGAPDDEEVELIPGVLHGGKRGEEELRSMEEAKEREAEEEGVDSVYVPYYYDPSYYDRRYPPRPRPPARPRPLPAPAPSRPVSPRSQ